jgi:hypothetical protein
MMPTIIGSIPYEGIKFGMFDVIKHFLISIDPSLTSSNEKKLFLSVMSGALAGVK